MCHVNEEMHYFYNSTLRGRAKPRYAQDNGRGTEEKPQSDNTVRPPSSRHSVLVCFRSITVVDFNIWYRIFTIEYSVGYPGTPLDSDW